MKHPLTKNPCQNLKEGIRSLTPTKKEKVWNWQLKYPAGLQNQLKLTGTQTVSIVWTISKRLSSTFYTIFIVQVSSTIVTLVLYSIPSS